MDSPSDDNQEVETQEADIQEVDIMNIRAPFPHSKQYMQYIQQCCPATSIDSITPFNDLERRTRLMEYTTVNKVIIQWNQ